ncbi:DinB family protein [Aureibaculum sp. 2210JD6-5]|uniref:DinB family protein n=1 Tax=Aureibaculum sp. 2210JD6-5 TaxID=3103957 RepID=UPI002AAC8E46|nr:DinB family protein [Aureibaculum sp. 2210JD6-5]MDY7395279.1 DinB family protein [Aureibaculum sp. 2210JD6-5]
MKSFLYIVLLLTISSINAQDIKTDLPYAEIPDYPEKYTATTVAARMIDGLGFRYYWATEDLRPEDLAYKITEGSRTSLETVSHIYDLSKVIVNATTKTPNSGSKKDSLSFAEIRKATLLNFKKASDILLEADSLEDFKIIFKNDYGTSEYPFWNNINGPIEDAVWHAGQIAVMRRASGNPFNSKVSVFSGKVRK